MTFQTSHLISALAVAEVDLNRSLSHCKFIHYFSLLKCIYSLLCTFGLKTSIYKKLFKSVMRCLRQNLKRLYPNLPHLHLYYFLVQPLSDIKTSLGKIIIDGLGALSSTAGELSIPSASSCDLRLALTEIIKSTLNFSYQLYYFSWNACWRSSKSRVAIIIKEL